MILITIITAVTLALTSLATPSPVIESSDMIVFNPYITYPNSGVTWRKGSSYNITWRTDNIPLEVADYTGVILLGHLGDDSENLDVAHPLATNFHMRDGIVLVTAPVDIPDRSDYFVVLFGDSGNKSPEFEIC